MILSILLLYLTTIQIIEINAQGTCSNTCPPINAGKEIQAVCPGDVLTSSFANTTKSYNVCHPKPTKNIQFMDYRRKGHVTVISNYYVGCEAGLRESGVFAHVAQRYYNMYGNRTTFIQSVKGGGSCEQWSEIYLRDASLLYGEENDITPKDMPLTINDVNYEIRDDLFTEPFKHPSYIILDGALKVRYKFIGPCCGYQTFESCNASTVLELDDILTNYVDGILGETESDVDDNGSDLIVDDTEEDVVTQEGNECVVGNWSVWSPCSVTCGTSSISKQFRWREVEGNTENCTQPPVETKKCHPSSTSTDCNHNENECVPEFGSRYSIEEVASGFNAPRDVAFHPTPGYHLQNYSSNRTFHPLKGEEAWVVNSGNHSVSIVASLGTEYQTTISRRDRGYYHYMINGSALAFNHVNDSGRSSDRDSFNYWAMCNDNLNTYLDKKEANYFMGPTLYNSNPDDYNLVNRLGDKCTSSEEECYFLHSDMLHESPGCIGIAHDPEVITAYGNVYWAFDRTGNRETGQLVRFDFQQPHGPGSMDHSVAAVRRYVEVELDGGSDNDKAVHAGMAVHPTRRELYISVPGANKIIVVQADSGSFSRFARQEYPIYSNRLPSFEYSIYECVHQATFAEGIQTPSGLALSEDRLFVVERETGRIKVYDIESAVLLDEIDTGLFSIGGLAFSPDENMLYFVDEDTNTLNRVLPLQECSNHSVSTRLNPEFIQFMSMARDTMGTDDLSLTRDYQCVSNPIIPDSSYFDQVHDDTGYADADPNVQSPQAAMDASAALLSNRTDCGYDSGLNFDALLLGGYYCHVCLPEQELNCDYGGVCTNVQWKGYTCDNEFIIALIRDDADTKTVLHTANGTIVDSNDITLKHYVTYRFKVATGEEEVCLIAKSGRRGAGNINTQCATKGSLLQHLHYNISALAVTMNDKVMLELLVDGAVIDDNVTVVDDKDDKYNIVEVDDKGPSSSSSSTRTCSITNLSILFLFVQVLFLL